MASTAAATSVTALAGTSETANDMRLALGALLQLGPDNRQSVSGVRGDSSRSSGLGLHMDSAGMAVGSYAGQCFIQGDGVTDGVWVCTFPHSTLDIAPADAANNRYDRVVAHVLNTGDANATGQLEVVTGVPGGGIPDLVALGYTNYLPIGRALVRAGVTSITEADLTDERTFTVALGGTPPGGGTDEPVWKTYTPAWIEASGETGLTLGNGSIEGRYLKDDRIGMCDFTVTLTFGSTTRWGSGRNFYVSTPAGLRGVGSWAVSGGLTWNVQPLGGYVADGDNRALVLNTYGFSGISDPPAGSVLVVSGRFRYQ